MSDRDEDDRPDDSDSEDDRPVQAEDEGDTDEGEGRPGDGESTNVGEPRAAPHAASSKSGRLLQWVLPPVLALGAVGVHWWLNVPAEPVVENPRDQGAKKSAAQKRKERAERRRQKRMHQPRPGAELDTLLERYDDTDFEKEPVVGKWARQTQTMLNKAVVMSRKTAFEGAPEEPRVSVVRTQCRTIRCQLLLRSPFEHEVQLLADTMKRLETLTGESIWLRFEAEPAEPPDGDEADKDAYLRITIALIADGIRSDELTVGEKAKAAEKVEGVDDENPSP